MKIFKLIHIIFLKSILYFSFSSAFGAENSSRPEIIEVKSRIEDSITRRYKERISTRLPQDLFNVDVQIELKIFDSNTDLVKTDGSKSASKAQANDLSDFNLGIIDSITSKNEAQSSERIFGLPKGFLDRIEIKKVEVIVGLSPKLGSEYSSSFRAWLTTTVRNDFGKVGSTKVAELAPIPKEESLPPLGSEGNPRFLTFEEKFGNYQNAVGLALFSLILIVGILLIKFIPSRDVKEQLSLSLQIQEMKNAQLQLQNSMASRKVSIDSRNSDPQEMQLSANLLFDTLKAHHKKVALIVLSSPVIVGQILDRWLEEGLEGRKKVASLVDCVLSFFGNNISEPPIIPAAWALPDKIKDDKELAGVFKLFSNLNLKEKTELVEKTYWDLLSMRTLGDKLSNSPFSSVAQLSALRIQKLLSQQDKKIQSLALLHLPQGKMEEVVSKLSFEEKKNMIAEAFTLPKMKFEDLEKVDRSLRVLIKQDETDSESFIEVQPLIPNVLMSLLPFEEIQLVQQILPTLPDHGIKLKQNYPSLAFISDWPEEKLKYFLSGVQAQEILSLIKALPEVAEQIFAVIPSRTQTILKDSLNKTLSSDEINRGLEALRLKLFNFVSDGQIKLDQIFKDDSTAHKKAA